jgi:hypothetical protein
MDMINLIINFERDMRDNPLKPTAQLMWYKILMMHNMANWSEWVEYPNGRLAMDMGMHPSSLRTIYKARDELVAAGYIKYKSRQEERLPSLYKILA